VKAVLIKGGHADGDEVTDVLLANGIETLFTSARIATEHTHGTGCSYASAIATGLAKGMPIEKAVSYAHDYVAKIIAHAPGLGQGHGPLGHNYMLTN
jgi:hydroxymethylpyrimidine/phosphomethylpyrimidine kinase